jgi:hypothetical protein
MRLGNRVNEGYAELSVCLYLPDGRIACQFKRPAITTNDRFDAGGISYTVEEPLKSVTMSYDGELIIVDNPDDLRDPQRLFATGPRLPGHVSWTHVAESPIHGGEPVDDTVQTMYGRDFSLGHFNQHGRARGVITVGDQTWKIDGHGWRDHSWGPRYWQVIYFYRLFLANFPNGDGREAQGPHRRRNPETRPAAQPAQDRGRHTGVAHRRRVHAVHLGRSGRLRHDRIYRAHRGRRLRRLPPLTGRDVFPSF